MRFTLIAVALLVVVAALRAAAADGLSIEGRFIDRDTGKVDAAPELLGAGDATWRDSRDPDYALVTLGSDDHGDIAEVPGDLLILVKVSAALVPAPATATLAVTVKHGKRTLASQKWKGRIGGYYALVIDPPFCSPPMVITAQLGKVKATRTVLFARSFNCGD